MIETACTVASVSSEDPMSGKEVKIYRDLNYFWICFEIVGAAFTKRPDDIREVYFKWHGLSLETINKDERLAYFSNLLDIKADIFFGIRVTGDKILSQPLHRNNEKDMIILVKDTIEKMYPGNKISFNEEKFKIF